MNRLHRHPFLADLLLTLVLLGICVASALALFIADFSKQVGS